VKLHHVACAIAQLIADDVQAAAAVDRGISAVTARGQTQARIVELRIPRPGAGLAPREIVWEHFAHGADIGIRGRGSDRDAAFAEAARALTAVMTDVDGVAPAVAVPIRCDAPDNELLLVAWLNAVIYEMATRHMVFGRFDVRTNDRELIAQAWGEHVEVARHHPAVEPKGATMTALRVAREPDATWLAQTVVDV
jgi:tRNA nucleotidyltransferase (CCA-adding enzyme)